MTVNSACSECHARAVCGVDESKDKVVEVKTSDAATYAVGESVEVALANRSMGAKSVFLAYVVPFFVLLLALSDCFNTVFLNRCPLTLRTKSAHYLSQS